MGNRGPEIVVCEVFGCLAHRSEIRQVLEAPSPAYEALTRCRVVLTHVLFNKVLELELSAVWINALTDSLLSGLVIWSTA